MHIIPDKIGENIERNADAAAKLRARKARQMMKEIRARRDAAQAVEPQSGEVREIRDAAGTENENAPVVRTEDTPDSGDPAVDHSYDHAGRTFDYFSRVHQRAGPNPAAPLMVSVVRYGNQWDNAAFDGKVILIGEGDIFPPFWKSADIFYHEWGHYFTQETCNLIYSGQPGGNNEHGSDWIAAVTEQWVLNQTAAEATWLIGAGLFTEGLKGRGLRDMLRRGPAYDDPIIGRDGQIDTADQYRQGMDVHDSSAIGNRAFAHACVTVGGRSWETIGPVWFDVWTRYLHSQSDFAHLAASTKAAAIEKYGATSRELDAILAGWDLVKVAIPTGPTPTPAPTPESPCNLPELLLLAQRPEVQAALAVVLRQPETHRLLARARLRGMPERESKGGLS